MIPIEDFKLISYVTRKHKEGGSLSIFLKRTVTGKSNNLEEWSAESKIEIYGSRI